MLKNMKIILYKNKNKENQCKNKFFYFNKAFLITVRINLNKKYKNIRQLTYFIIIIRYIK